MSRYILEFFFSLLGLFFPLVLIFSYVLLFLLPSFLFPPSLSPLSSFLLTSESSYRNVKRKFEKRNKNLSYFYSIAVCVCIILPLRIFWFAHIIYNYMIAVKVNNLIQLCFTQLMTVYDSIK